MSSDMDMDMEAAEFARKFWWIFLVTGILWFLLSLFILRFNTQSLTTIGVLIGVLFTVGAFNEFLTAWAVPGWKWLHIILGVLFVGGAIWGYANPEDAAWALASVLGLLFVLNGTLMIVESIATKEINSLWWLGLVSGILMLLLGFWASQQYILARAALLILWVGLGAMIRGIGEIVMAFRIKSGGGGQMAIA